MNSFTNNRVVQIDFDASVSKDLSGTCKRLILTANQPAYISFNKASVTIANGFFLPANIPVEVPLSQVSSVQAIKASSAGKLTILELF